jgi:hypothetical protein
MFGLDPALFAAMAWHAHFFVGGYGDVEYLHGETARIRCSSSNAAITSLLSDCRAELKNGRSHKLRRHLNRADRLQQELLHTGSRIASNRVLPGRLICSWHLRAIATIGARCSTRI